MKFTNKELPNDTIIFGQVSRENEVRLGLWKYSGNCVRESLNTNIYLFCFRKFEIQSVFDIPDFNLACLFSYLTAYFLILLIPDRSIPVSFVHRVF